MERVAGMTTAVDDDDDDDEFAYAFEGGERDETNVPVEKFVAKEMPRELVTNVRSMPMETFAEEDEEDLEETIEEDEDDEAEADAEEEEDEDEDEVEVVMEDEDAEVASDGLAAKLAPRDATSSATSAPPSTSAVDEWDQVNALREEEQHVRASDEAGTSEEDQFGSTKRFASISYVDAVRGIVEKIDVAALKPTLHVEDAPAGGCLACLFAPPRLDGDELKRDRDEMFATARTKLDDENEVHLSGAPHAVHALDGDGPRDAEVREALGGRRVPGFGPGDGLERLRDAGPDAAPVPRDAVVYQRGGDTRAFQGLDAGVPHGAAQHQSDAHGVKGCAQGFAEQGGEEAGFGVGGGGCVLLRRVLRVLPSVARRRQDHHGQRAREARAGGFLAHGQGHGARVGVGG